VQPRQEYLDEAVDPKKPFDFPPSLALLEDIGNIFCGEQLIEIALLREAQHLNCSVANEAGSNGFFSDERDKI
jgi:hypothetical protein